jgi:hypothetical protein
MCEVKMEFIRPLEKQKKELASQLRQELLFVGLGPDNSATIDKLNGKIASIEESIDILYMVYKLPRDVVDITPYAYLHGLSSTDDMKPFFDKLTTSGGDKFVIKDKVGKVLSATKTF